MGTLNISAEVLRRAHEVAAGISATVDARQILTGRAALLGLTARGRVSAGSATHLMQAADGWCALTLSRPDDIAAIPALLEVDDVTDPWPAIHRWVREQTVEHVTERAGLLDLPTATLGEASATPPRITKSDNGIGPRLPAGLLVVDLTSMWAGPLCGQLLARAGAVVVKVESPLRPDGTRAGNQAFFDWMNSGKLSYAADFTRDATALRRLLEAADVVLEGSRPAALQRRGLGAQDVAARPGRVWLRVTGHGAHADRVAFGDDAAVAGGLVSRDADGPVFSGDAIADPLTGLAATAAVLASLQRGGGEVIDLSMSAVAAQYAAGSGAPLEPTLPPPAPPAAALGADNAAVQRLVAERLCAPC
ncbi:MAG: CoA transferase [Mycobacterium sp.]